jgi:Fe-Mn family superoxide dismutase
MLRTLCLLLLTSPTLAAQFELPDLPYPTDALQPFINAESLELHHQRHHRIHVSNLNSAIARDPRLEGMTLEQILRSASEYDEVLRQQAGAHFNHSLFWQVLAPTGAGGEPSDALTRALEARFGSMQGFKQQFEDAALGVFGSGWAWLLVDTQGELQISTTANQDNPLMDTASPHGEPLLALDVWEHAYYLQYRNVRADYVRGWWPNVNWNEVNRRFAEAGGVQ